MTVSELFEKCDPELVFYAFIQVNHIFEDFEKINLSEKADVFYVLKDLIAEVCKYISHCKIEDSEPNTIFVTYKSCVEYGESYKRIYDAFYTSDSEVLSALDKKFTLWNDDGDTRIMHYGLALSSYERIAGYSVADVSIAEVGEAGCCGVILWEMSHVGLLPEEREEKIKELVKSLEEAEKSMDEGKTYTSDEVSAMFEEDFYSNATDDEKEHHCLEKQYEESVKEIELREREKVLNKDHERLIKLIRQEYQNKNEKV